MNDQLTQHYRICDWKLPFEVEEVHYFFSCPPSHSFRSQLELCVANEHLFPSKILSVSVPLYHGLSLD